MKLPFRSDLAHIHSQYSSQSHVIPLSLLGDDVAQGMRLLESLSVETLRPASSLYSLEGSHGWRVYEIADRYWWVRDQLCGFLGIQEFIWFISAERLASKGPSHFEESALRLIIKQMVTKSQDESTPKLFICLLPSKSGDTSQALNAQARVRELLSKLGYPAPYQARVSLPGASKSSLLRYLSERAEYNNQRENLSGHIPHRFIDDWVTIPTGEATGENGETWSVSSAFAIGQTPVTQSLYEAVMKIELPLRHGPLYPATAVSWLDAVTFCNQLSLILNFPPYYEIKSDQAVVNVIDPQGLGIRLPTKSEWCYSALGGRPWPYSGSDLPEEVAWSAHNSGSKLRPVARLKHNDFGCYDFSGNVWEWSQEGSRDKEQVEICVGDHHPKWLLGGSWANHPWVFPIGESLSELPGYRDEFMGFRVARHLPNNETSPTWFISRQSDEASS